MLKLRLPAQNGGNDFAEAKIILLRWSQMRIKQVKAGPTSPKDQRADRCDVSKMRAAFEKSSEIAETQQRCHVFVFKTTSVWTVRNKQLKLHDTGTGVPVFSPLEGKSGRRVSLSSKTDKGTTSFANKTMQLDGVFSVWIGGLKRS